jgi:hypothetical protein
MFGTLLCEWIRKNCRLVSEGRAFVVSVMNVTVRKMLLVHQACRRGRSFALGNWVTLSDPLLLKRSIAQVSRRRVTAWQIQCEPRQRSKRYPALHMRWRRAESSRDCCFEVTRARNWENLNFILRNIWRLAIGNQLYQCISFGWSDHENAGNWRVNPQSMSMEMIQCRTMVM